MSVVRSLPDPNEEARVCIAVRLRLNKPVFLVDDDSERLPGVPADNRLSDLVPPIKTTKYVLDTYPDPVTGERLWRWVKAENQ